MDDAAALVLALPPADGQPFKMPATIDDASVLPEIEAALKAAGFCKPIPEDKM